MGADYKHKRRDRYTGATETALATNGASQAFPPDAISTPAAAAARAQIAKSGGHIIRAYCRIDAAPGGAATRTLTLNIEGAPSAVTVTFQPADVVQIWNGAVPINEGDYLVWESDGGVGVPAAARAFCTLVVVPN